MISAASSDITSHFAKVPIAACGVLPHALFETGSGARSV
jgi:hypothetical protein